MSEKAKVESVPDDEIDERFTECTLCEGEGQVCENFDLFSDGVPDIVPCPKCDGTGEQIDGSESDR